MERITVKPEDGDTLYPAITEDGSLSLVSGEYTELYHNRAGAFSEALLSYSRVAFAVWREMYGENLPKAISVFDCCFGLGYNSFALAQEAPAGMSLDITGVEIDPRVLEMLPRILQQPCFRPLVESGLGAAEAERLSRCEPVSIASTGKSVSAGENARLNITLVTSCLRAYLLGQQATANPVYDLILHDPFSPKRLTELWTIDLFAEYKKLLKPGGIILTYSSAPAVRGALQDLGFCVYRTPAQGGSSCGTLAILGENLEAAVHSDRLAELVMLLEDEEIRRLQKSSRVPYRDPGLMRQRADIVAARVQEQQLFKTQKSQSQS